MTQKTRSHSRPRDSVKRPHTGKPLQPIRPPALSWSIHRDLARLLVDWQGYVERLGRDAFSLLLVLEAVRLQSRTTDVFRYRDLEKALNVSPATLRRWLRILKSSGLLTVEPSPGSNRTEVHFRIHLESPSKRTPKSSLRGERTNPGNRRRSSRSTTS